MNIRIKKCNVLYEYWQMQCCGEPIAVGSQITLLADYYRPRTLGASIYVDFDENHHDSICYSLSGVVSKMSAIVVGVDEQSNDQEYRLKTFTSFPIDYFDGRENLEAFEGLNGRPEYCLIEMTDVEIRPYNSDDRSNTFKEFSIKIDNMFYGWESVVLNFNGIEIPFEASYIGDEPVSSLIVAVNALDCEYDSESSESNYTFSWKSEPGVMELSFNHNLKSGKLFIEIMRHDSGSPDESSRCWNIEMDYPIFRSAVIYATINTLQKYGILGFEQNWAVESFSFPLTALLSAMGATTFHDSEEDTFKSDIHNELSLLSFALGTKHKEE